MPKRYRLPFGPLAFDAAFRTLIFFLSPRLITVTLAFLLGLAFSFDFFAAFAVAFFFDFFSSAGFFLPAFFDGGSGLARTSLSLSAARAATNLAIGTRNGEQET